MVLLCLVSLFISETKVYEIQLNGDHKNFSDFRLVFEGEKPFSQAGTAQVHVDDPSGSFEVVGPNGHIYFFGVWNQFEKDSPIQIELSQPSVAFFELVTANRMKQVLLESPAEMAVVKLDDPTVKQISLTTDHLKSKSNVHLQKTNLGGGSPILRGMSGNRVLYLLNGFRINNGTYRLGLNQYLNSVPSDSLQQIEVMCGPAGVQFGSDGLGGAVHLISKSPISEFREGWEYNQFVSTADGTHSESLHFGFHPGPFGVRGHIKSSSLNDLPAPEPVGKQVPTGFDQIDAAIDLGWSIGDGLNLIMNNMASSSKDVPRTDRIWSGKDLLWTYDPQRFQFHGLRLEHTRPRRLWDRLETGLAFSRQEEGRNRISTSRPNRLENAFDRVDSWQGFLTMTRLIGPHQLVYGADFQSDSVSGYTRISDLDSNSVEFVDPKFPNDATYRQGGAFAISVIELLKGLNIRMGLRYAMAELQGTLPQPLNFQKLENNQLSPVLSMSLRQQHHFLNVGASSGFRSPNLEDALSIGFSNKGFDAPNPGLEPETVWNYEVTYRHQHPSALFQATAFLARYKDLIERVPGTYQGQATYDGESVFVLDNVGKAEVEGLSLSYRKQFQVGWALSTSGSWLKGTQTETGQPMTRIPPLKLNLNLSRSFDGVSVGFQLDYASRQDRLSPDDLNDSRIPEGGTPSYLVAHVRSSWNISKKAELSLAMENLGDVLYKQHGSGIYEAGRRVVLRLKVKP